MLYRPTPKLNYFAAGSGGSVPTAWSGQVGTLLTSGGSTNTFGTWTQIHAGLTYPSAYILVMLNGAENSAGSRSIVSVRTTVNIGIGPDSGTVTTIIEKLGGANAAPCQYYWIPIRIPPDTPVWAQSSGEAASMRIGIVFSVFGGNSFPGTFPSCSKVVALGAGASTDGTAVTPTTNGTEDAWTEIVASTSEDYIGVMASTLFNADSSMTDALHSLVDIGLGAAGSEFTIGENVAETFLVSTGEAKMGYSIPSFYHVPAGSRLSARVSGTTTADTSPTLILYGLVA